MSSFYIKETGWIVMNTQKQFLTTKAGKACWTNSLLNEDPVFFDSEEEANQRIRRIKTNAIAILIDNTTPTKQIFSIWEGTHNIRIDVFEVPKFCDKWDSNLYYEIENVQKQFHKIRSKMIRDKQRQIENLKQEIANLESQTDDDINKEINNSVSNLERMKKYDANMASARKKKKTKCV